MHEYRSQTRWLDYDLLGHVTHTAIVNFFDEARDAFLEPRTGPFDQWPSVIVRGEIDYLHEIPWPTPEVIVRTEVADVGRTSVTFRQEFIASGHICARARTVIVHWDASERRATEINESDRTRLLRPSAEEANASPG